MVSFKCATFPLSFHLTDRNVQFYCIAQSDTRVNLLTKCAETRCGFKDIEVQKRMLRKELSSIVDDDDKMGYDDFEFALTQLMNFVGVKHNIDCSLRSTLVARLQ